MTNEISVWESNNQPVVGGVRRYFSELGIRKDSALADLIDNAKDAQLSHQEREYPNMCTISIYNRDMLSGSLGEPAYAILISDPGKSIQGPNEAIADLLTFGNGQTEDPDRYREQSQGTYGAGTKQSTVSIAHEYYFLFSPMGDSNIYRAYHPDKDISRQRVDELDILSEDYKIFLKEMRYKNFYGSKAKIENISGFVVVLKNLKNNKDFPTDCCRKLRRRIRKMPKLKRLYSKNKDFTIQVKGRPSGGSIKFEDPMFFSGSKDRIDIIEQNLEIIHNKKAMFVTAIYDKERSKSNKTFEIIVRKDGRYFGTISALYHFYGKDKLPFKSKDLNYSKIEFDLRGNDNNKYFGINPIKNDPQLSENIDEWMLEKGNPIREILEKIKEINKDISETKILESDKKTAHTLSEIIKKDSKKQEEKKSELSDPMDAGADTNPSEEGEVEKRKSGSGGSGTVSPKQTGRTRGGNTKSTKLKKEIPFGIASYNGKAESDECFRHSVEPCGKVIVELNQNHKFHKRCLEQIGSGDTAIEDRGSERKLILALQAYSIIESFIEGEIDEEVYEEQQVRVGRRFWEMDNWIKKKKL